MTKIKKLFNLHKWAAPLFMNHRYCVLWGGRGSGKSYTIADSLLLIAYSSKKLILCGREFQNSIKDSVYSLLKQRIEENDLLSFFTITQDEIRCIHTGSRFIFKGLRNNIDSIKSMAGINYLWIEEADTLSEESWRIIKPTIREEKSQIWITLNPKNRTDCIYREFIDQVPPENSYVKKVNWSDNIYFPETLNQERLNDFKRDVGMYNHVWEGDLLEHSDAQIFKGKWIIDDFEEDIKENKYYGLDFGYSVDPTAAVRCYIKKNTLYITHEAGKVNLEIDVTGNYCVERIPDFKRNRIIADSSRPETIAYMRRQGFFVEGAKKGKGSVEDGIAFIRSFDRVVIHSRCKQTINEFTLYSYKVEHRSGDITTDIVDAYNHYIDALRYSLERVMSRKQANYKILTKM